MKVWVFAAAMAVAVAVAGAGHAGDFCGPNALADTASLNGDWTGRDTSLIGVGADGKPQAMALDDLALKITVAADAGGLALSAADDFFPPMTLTAIASVAAPPDFALPGESPLAAAELLAPEVAAAGLACDPASLPQFAADVAMDGDAGLAVRVFALTPDLMVMVMTARGTGQTARAVFDLTRVAPTK